MDDALVVFYDSDQGLHSLVLKVVLAQVHVHDVLVHGQYGSDFLRGLWPEREAPEHQLPVYAFLVTVVFEALRRALSVALSELHN